MTNKITNNDDLTANEIKFSRLVAKGIPFTTAYRQSFPAKSDLAYNTIRAYARELYQKASIVSEVATARETQATLARLAEDRLHETLSEGKQGSRVVNDVAMFMYDHANGKATIKAEIKSAHVSVTYDLSGGAAGDVPPEVLAQLNQA